MKDDDVRRLAATTLAIALLLAGCAGTDDSSATDAASDGSTTTSTASAADVKALAGVTVEGDTGTEPTLTFDQPFTVSSLVSRVASEGTGDVLTEGQLVTLHYLAVSGADGSSQGSTYTGSPEAVTLAESLLGADMTNALVGQKVGARILFGIPDTESSNIMLVEIMSATDLPDRASGEAVAPVDGLPVITLAEDGTPSIAPVAGDAPTTLVVQPLIKGDGPTVEANQTVAVHYSGWLWDGTPFDSSWGAAPFPAALVQGQIIDGWIQGLAGQTVGSQVLLVIPPELGYGDQENGTIPANSTLVFVVDILAVS